MSDVELRNFEKQLDVLSFTEQLAIVDYLIKSMQKQQELFAVERWKKEERMRNVQQLFELMDANPGYSNGEKWSREELYER